MTKVKLKWKYPLNQNDVTFTKRNNTISLLRIKYDSIQYTATALLSLL